MSIRRHTTYNVAGAAVSIVVALVTVPLYIATLGEARYGVLAIAWLFIGYFGAFDLGLSRAVAQRIATEAGVEPHQVGTTFWTALVINVALGLIGVAIAVPIGFAVVQNSLQAGPLLNQEIIAALPYFVLAVPVLTMSGVLIGTLQGLSRFGWLNSLVSVGGVVGQVAPLLAAVFFAPTLPVVIAVAVVARAGLMLALLGVCLMTISHPFPPRTARPTAAALLKFGGWVTVTSVVSPLMVVLDRIIIGAISGARAVSHYTVPFQLAERLTMLPAAFSSALFPRFADEAATSDRLLASSLSSIVVIMTPVACAALLLLDPFLTFWISPRFAEAAAVPGRMLILAFWFNSIALIPYTYLQARHRPDVVAKFHLLELGPYLALLFMCIDAFGVVGAALAFTIRVVCDLVLLSIAARCFRFLLSLAGIPLIWLFAAFALASSGEFDDPAFIVGAPILILLPFFWAMRSMPPEIGRALASLRELQRHG